jgi:hypothetical protein
VEVEPPVARWRLRNGRIPPRACSIMHVSVYRTYYYYYQREVCGRSAGWKTGTSLAGVSAARAESLGPVHLYSGQALRFFFLSFFFLITISERPTPDGQVLSKLRQTRRVGVKGGGLVSSPQRVCLVEEKKFLGVTSDV